MGRTIATIAERTAELARVLGVVGEAVGLVIEYLDRQDVGPQDRRGGYCCLAADYERVPIIVHAQIGLVPAEKDSKYHALSAEKVRRLAGRPGDVSSWQSRDPQAWFPGQPQDEDPWGQWGGGIRARRVNTLYAFSGLPELADEAAMLLAAVKLGVLNIEQAFAIAQISSNELYRDITSWLHGRSAWNSGYWMVPQE